MEELIKVQDLSVEFKNRDSSLKAVRGVSFSINKGEVFALVGESGCGKSTTAHAIMRLIEKPGRITDGTVSFEGKELLSLKEREMDNIRGRDIGMIFQNPLDSLNPVYTIGSQIIEGLVHDGKDRQEAYDIARRVLTDVKITDVERRMRSFPHEISGGMRQRVMIAMMLCRKPRLLIADEPTTALDVTIQAGILDLMQELKDEYGTAILLITHDFGVVADIADRVGVMYAGELVELADTDTIFDNAMHPYTRMLVRSLPTLAKGEGRLQSIDGNVPDLSKEVKGCGFAPRCPMAGEECFRVRPDTTEPEKGHFVACHRAAEQGGQK